MDSFITTFHIDWKIIIAQTINFIVVLFVLYYLIVKPLKKLMKDRTADITGGLNDAKANAELLANTKKEYDQVILNARTEANTIFQEGKHEAETNKTEMMEKAKKEVDNMIANGKKVLLAEKARIIEEARQEIVSLVVLSTEKLLETHPDAKIDESSMSKIKKI
jgi:F-type H+-transporting ATPase subunit b